MPTTNDIQNNEITAEHLQCVFSAAASVTGDAALIFEAMYEEPMYLYPADEHLLKTKCQTQQWNDVICPKILKEIPQSVADFFEQFQLTADNLRHIVIAINLQPDQKATEAQHYAISDTLYDTLVQTGMHQKTITDLLQLIEQYANNIRENLQTWTANRDFTTDTIQNLFENQLQSIQQLQDALQTLRNAWNLTKLKFSTIISDIEIAVDDYPAHLTRLNLQAALKEWEKLTKSLLGDT
ncbi:hypothetical protein [Taibaiella soli]|nr:hypothetical protein [Taibaiella soli]